MLAIGVLPFVSSRCGCCERGDEPSPHAGLCFAAHFVADSGNVHRARQPTGTCTTGDEHLSLNCSHAIGVANALHW